MTVTTFDPNADAVTMSEAALLHFKKALSGKENQLVRLSTKQSGCSGFAYELDLVDAAEDGDELVTPSDDVTLAIAADAVAILRGTQIDIAVEGINRVVKFNNPNVVAECGCGESFSVN